jgi:hypothetical protein
MAKGIMDNEVCSISTPDYRAMYERLKKFHAEIEKENERLKYELKFGAELISEVQNENNRLEGIISNLPYSAIVP